MRTVLRWLLPLLGLLALAMLSAGASAKWQDINLTWDGPDEQEVSGNGTAIFNFTLTVTGDGATALLLLEFNGEPEGWQHSLTAKTSAGTLSSNGSLALTLAILELVPVQLLVVANLTRLMGSYPMSVYVSSQLIPSNNVTRALSVSVPRWTALSVVPIDAPPDALYAGYPGSVISFRVGVLNLGNAPDAFHLTIDHTLATFGWRAYFDGGVNATGWTPVVGPDLAGERPHVVTVSVLMPEREKAGVVCWVFVNATARSNASVESKPVHVGMECLQYFELMVSVQGASELVLGPGEVGELRLHACNLGNGPDNLTLDLRVDDAATAWLFAAPNPRWLLLGMDGVGTFTCVVRATEEAPTGTCYLWATVSSSCPDSVPVKRLLEVEIVQVHGVALTFPMSEVAALPGDDVVFTGEVHNTGNGPERVDLAVKGPSSGWDAELDPPWVMLDAGRSTDVEVRVTVPSSFETVPASRHLLTVTATGVAVTQEVRLTLSLSPFERVEWQLWERRLTSPAAPEATAPGGRLNPFSGSPRLEVFGLGLLSLGNVGTTVHLEASCPTSELELDLFPAAPRLAPNSSLGIRFVVGATMTSTPGDHVVEVTARLGGGQTRVVRVHITVELLDLAVRSPLLATGPGVDDKGDGNATVTGALTLTLVVTVANTGNANVTDGLLHIEHVGPDGTSNMLDTYPVRIGAGNHQTLTFTWTVGEKGTHRLLAYVELDDQAQRGNDLGTLWVAVKGAQDEDDGGPSRALLLRYAAIGVAATLVLVLLASMAREGRARRRGPHR